jgi:hypothetical protein
VTIVLLHNGAGIDRLGFTMGYLKKMRFVIRIESTSVFNSISHGMRVLVHIVMVAIRPNDPHPF